MRKENELIAEQYSKIYEAESEDLAGHEYNPAPSRILSNEILSEIDGLHSQMVDAARNDDEKIAAIRTAIAAELKGKEAPESLKALLNSLEEYTNQNPLAALLMNMEQFLQEEEVPGYEFS